MKKEVYFDEWCDKCKYSNTEETEDPCNECLGQPWNEDSHKPIKWKEKEK